MPGRVRFSFQRTTCLQFGAEKVWVFAFFRTHGRSMKGKGTLALSVFSCVRRCLVDSQGFEPCSVLFPRGFSQHVETCYYPCAVRLHMRTGRFVFCCQWTTLVTGRLRTAARPSDRLVPDTQGTLLPFAHPRPRYSRVIRGCEGLTSRRPTSRT